MKEAATAFQSEVFTPVVTLVAPGAIAMAPWCIGYVWRHQEHSAFLEKHNLEVWAVTVFVAVILGLMLENLGTMIESYVFDTRIQADRDYEHHAAHESDWYQYLRLVFKAEPVGHRYLRTLVLHLRFERNGCIGFATAAIGYLYLPVSRLNHTLAATLLWLVAFHLYFEAKRSHRALSELRHELLKGFVVIGDGSLNSMPMRKGADSTKTIQIDLQEEAESKDDFTANSASSGQG